MSSATFGDLRSLLHEAPSALRWDLLLETLIAWREEGQFEESTIAYCQARTRDWPDALRVAHPNWLGAMLIDTPNPLMELATTLVVDHLGPGKFEVLLQRQELKSFRSIHFENIRLSPDQCRALANCEQLRALQHLQMRASRIREEGARALAHSTCLQHITTLELPWNRLGQAGIEALVLEDDSERRSGSLLRRFFPGSARSAAPTERFPKLRKLDLCGNIARAGGLRALLRSPLLPRLRALDLSFNYAASVAPSGRHREAQPDLGALDELRLVCEERCANLELLELDHNALGSKGLRLLCEGKPWPALRRLHLGWNEIDDDGFEQLGGNQLFPSLRALLLPHNALGTTGLRALLRWPQLNQLEELDLSGLRAQSAEALLELLGALAPGSLHTLALNEAGLGPAQIHALARLPALRGLQRLELSGNRLDAHALGALMASQHLPALTHLELVDCRMLPVDLDGLCAANLPARLTTLRMAYNPQLNLEGLARLLEAPALQRLEMIDLGNCGAEPDALRAILLQRAPSQLRGARLGQDRRLLMPLGR